MALDEKEIVMRWTRTMREILWSVAIFILRDVIRPEPLETYVRSTAATALEQRIGLPATQDQKEHPPSWKAGIGICGSGLRLIDPTIPTTHRTIGAVGGLSVTVVSATWPDTISIPHFGPSTSAPPPASKPARPESLMRRYLPAPSITTNFPLAEAGHPLQ